MLKKGVKIVAVKLDNKGCYVTDGKRGHHVEAFKVNVVDTTGASDAFCAGFLYGLIKHKSLEGCGRIRNFVTSRCTTKMGARIGLPTLEDLTRINWHDIDLVCAPLSIVTLQIPICQRKRISPAQFPLFLIAHASNPMNLGFTISFHIRDLRDRLMKLAR